MPPSVVAERNRQQAEDRDRRQHTEDWMRLPDVQMSEHTKRPLGLPAHPPPAYMVSADGILPPAAGPALPPLTSIQSPFADNEQSPTSLPSFAALTASSLNPTHPRAPTTSPPLRSEPWPSLNPLTAYYSPNSTSAIASPERTDADISRTVSAIASPRDGRAASVNMDDPDVRLAAEALGDLRAGACCISSPHSVFVN
jgi:transcriptional repressor OPI1